MSIFSSLFSSKTIIETAAKGAYNGIDMAIFTDEEKSIAQQKVNDWLLDYHKATAPQNLSRRYIAVIVTLLWAFLIMVTVVLKIVGLHTPAQLVFDLLKDVVVQPFSIIIGFYFLAQIAGKFGK